VKAFTTERSRESNRIDRTALILNLLVDKSIYNRLGSIHCSVSRFLQWYQSSRGATIKQIVTLSISSVLQGNDKGLIRWKETLV
jgi:hypothetical protein